MDLGDFPVMDLVESRDEQPIESTRCATGSQGGICARDTNMIARTTTRETSGGSCEL